MSRKLRDVEASGFDPDKINPILFPFQSAIVRWACRMGRAAIFADCGLGKTFMQLEFGRLSRRATLIVAPLSVSDQTISEASKLGLSVRYCSDQSEILYSAGAINITNYDRIRKFTSRGIGTIILDESSILKSVDGKTRNFLISEFSSVPYRLACTATPAPNDISEIANHAEFLGHKTRQEMLGAFFVHDSSGWRLKGHASSKFYEWLASWSVFLRRPSDLGFSDEGYDLPDLNLVQRVVDCEIVPDGFLFPVQLSDGIVGRSKIRRETLGTRVAETAELVNSDSDQWIVWCGLNDESDALERSINGAVSIKGSDRREDKIKKINSFLTGEARVLVTKPTIAGFGMNFQHVSRMVFCGIGDSWEQYYQCVRRCWRFGQKFQVDVYIITTTAEESILENVMRKEREANKMAEEVIRNIGDIEKEIFSEASTQSDIGPENTLIARGQDWTLYRGDCVEVLSSIPSETADLSVFSPPFSTLYTYSDSPKDMGNCRDDDEFFSHFEFLVHELLRVTKRGRIACVHISQIPAKKSIDGFVGIKDFRGRVISCFVEAGWTHHAEIAVDKCPQAQAIRTRSKRLVFAQKNKDRSWIGPALADFVILFRKPGQPENRIVGNVTNEEWIEWARPIWYGISETEVLNVAEARDNKDERHICPLQLPLIRRCIKLWSNPGEVVLSPFAGIGSEGYSALQLGRKFIGSELKESYWRVARKNLLLAEESFISPDLFSGSGGDRCEG